MNDEVKSSNVELGPRHTIPAHTPEQRGSETATSGTIAVEPYIDKHEVARRMGKTTRTVDNMMRRGLIPYYKLGYRVAFRWSEIQSHLVETCRVCRRPEETFSKQTKHQE